MKNQVFIPTVATKEEDILTSWKIQEPLREVGYIPGLMLVLFRGIKGLEENADAQYKNLARLCREYGNFPIIAMLSNFPIEEVDFLHNPARATEHVIRGVDFTKNLPIGGRKIMTYHLETLVTEEEFKGRDEKEWKTEFEKAIAPNLEQISRYAAEQGVEAKIETAPVPSFGDIRDEDKRTYREVRLNKLRSPFYLTHQWGFAQARNCGAGICLDLCHNRTIYNVASNGDEESLLHASDRAELIGKSLLDDVRTLDSSDLVHLNDGLGKYSSKGEVFQEGVAVGKGDIKNMELIIESLNADKIPFVIEVNETDFKTRPNTRKSIEYLTH